MRFSKIIHQFIKLLKIEEYIIQLSAQKNFFQKFIPLHLLYKNPTIKTVKRNGVKFHLNISDYMQWHVWAGLKDQSWQKAILNDGGVVIDVGANVGSFALKVLANTKNTLVYAFEPNIQILEMFKNNLKINKNLASRLVINSYGLSNKCGESTFFINNANSGASGLGSKNSTGKSIQVKLNTIDNYVNENKITDIRFIKIDVEGFEPQVIEGAINTITKFKPQLYIEVTPVWWNLNGYHINDIIEPLIKMGYKLYPVIDENNKNLIETDLVEILKIKTQYNLYIIQ